MKYLVRTLIIATISFICLAHGSTSVNAGSKLVVEFADPAWDGKSLPEGQQCNNPHGGNGSSPPLRVSSIPPEADAIVIEFNDKNYQQLSFNGGHGTLGFDIKPGIGSVVLPTVQGETKEMPEGVWLVSNNKVTNKKYREPGYLPPCSGGRNHRYEAIVYAVKVKDKAEGKQGYKKLSKGKIIFARY